MTSPSRHNVGLLVLASRRGAVSIARSRGLVSALLTALLLSNGCGSCRQAAEMSASRQAPATLSDSPPSDPVDPPDVLPPQCAVIASASTEEGPVPLVVQFSADGLCTDAAGSFAWNFGDGSHHSDEKSPAHTYTQPGTFFARVTLEDSENDARDADELAITVTAQ